MKTLTKIVDPTNRVFTLLCAVALLFGSFGCKDVSSGKYAAERTAKLRELYSPGTSKEAIHAKWAGKPDFVASRPAGGWSAYPNKYLAAALNTVETNTGKQVASVERFWGPDGFLSLARCWYYYDSDDRLVDVEWEYMSD
jgi:hypothetical protein